MSSAPEVRGSRRETATTAPARAPRTAVAAADVTADGLREGLAGRFAFFLTDFLRVGDALARGRTLLRWLDLRAPARPEDFRDTRFRSVVRFARAVRLAPRFFAPPARLAAAVLRVPLPDARFATGTSFVRSSIHCALHRTGGSGLVALSIRAGALRRAAYNGLMKRRFPILIIGLTLALGAHARGTAQSDPAALVKEARQLENRGDLTGALATYRKAVEQNPSQFDAHLGIGRVMDLEGKYGEARQHIQKAIDLAPATGRNAALSTMGVSYAFEGNAAEAAQYYQKAFDSQVAGGAPDAAAGTANALGRVYLESGDAANAERWYRRGYETAQKIGERSPEDVDLWDMRWHHAQARIAARRKQFDAARKHADAVRALVEKGTLDQGQQANYPHLLGYIAFHEGKYDEAIAALAKADQGDPFILSLLAQACEAKKDQAKARELYDRILGIQGHTLQVAFSRPLAQRRLAGR
jgi:tetratricopeptide (TPR) repeat protein